MTEAHRTEDHKPGSEPAYPVPLASTVDGSIYNSIQQSGGENGGLTKRELFAAMAMQGIMMSTLRNDDPHLVASRAINAADFLLKELAK
jgi:hypothetical protein